MSPNNRSITQAHDGQVIVGIKKDLQNVSSLPLASSTYTMAALEQLIQSRIDAVNTVANPIKLASHTNASIGSGTTSRVK